MTLINFTGYNNLTHFHGLATTGDVDGANERVSYGVGTSIGPKLKLHFPPIVNNSTTLWVHNHNMFATNDYNYSGMTGMLQIRDVVSDSVMSYFVPGDNQLFLNFQDMDLLSDGTLTRTNIYMDENRSCFGLVNGISCVNWYSSDLKPYVDSFYHNCSRNLIKIDILNAGNDFRYLYLGVCDEEDTILPFYLIQSDAGLMNPTRLTMVEIPHASRVSILIETKKTLHVFCYNYDLTEVGNVQVTKDQQLEALVPDVKQSSNPSPNPTPIPGPDTTLLYPVIKPIPTILQTLRNGNIIPPQESKLPFTIRKFLRIKRTPKRKSSPHVISLDQMITRIRKVVFGPNYSSYCSLIRQPNFEYSSIDYISLLNPDYFYNLPNPKEAQTKIRQFLMFADDQENSNVPGGNPLGSSEFINGANRVMADMWNSEESNLTFAMKRYLFRPNAYKPKVLPTCLFSILSSDTKYSNLQMVANDTLTIQLFSSPITYQTDATPLYSFSITFPPTNPSEPLNVDKWCQLFNQTMSKYGYDREAGKEGGKEEDQKGKVKLSDVLELDWTWYPFQYDSVTKKTWIIQTTLLKLINKSTYWVRVLGPWTALQMIGKSFMADLPMTNNNENNNKDITKSDMSMPMEKSLQQLQVYYATNDPDAPLPLKTNMDNAQLIVSPLQTFTGFVDGFMNCALINFSVGLNVSETWVYNNGDTQDSHMSHFHGTSGFALTDSPFTSPGLVSPTRKYAPLLYSKETYGIGPQQSLAWNIKFVHYTSPMSVLNPPVRGVGYVHHCHLNHESMNMMQAFWVYRDASLFHPL
jgi:hypothetical protein